MNKVLLSFVGNRDPYDQSGKEGSLLSLYDEVKPDIIYLFPSAEKTAPIIKEKRSETESNAKDVAGILAEKSPPPAVSIRPLEVTDVTNFVQLSNHFEEKISAVIVDLTKGGKSLNDYEFHINCSSGTQQMMTLGYVLASAGRFPAITRWQVKDPDFVPVGHKRIIKIEADIIGENTYVQRIRGNVKKFNFISIRNDLQSLAEIATGARKENAEALRKIFEAYGLMDILRYDGASDMIKKVNDNPPEHWELEIIDLLNSQTKILENLKGERVEETPENLIDLYFNMQRCFERGAYADVFSRFWRLGEGTLYYRVQSTYEINPRNIGKSVNRTNSDTLLAAISRTPGTSTRFLNFEGARRALEAFKDEKYKALIGEDDWGNKISNLTKARNNTIVAHGMHPVSRTDAEKCLTVSQQVLTKFLPDGASLIEKYPFRTENIEKIAKVL
jgi:hypothetical protein